MNNNIWLKYNKISDTDGMVQILNYVPNDPVNGIPQDKQNEGVFVDSIPEAQIQEGKYGELHINPTTLELFYVYKDTIKTPEEIQQDAMDKLILDNINMQQQIDTLIMSSL